MHSYSQDPTVPYFLQEHASRSLPPTGNSETHALNDLHVVITKRATQLASQSKPNIMPRTPQPVAHQVHRERPASAAKTSSGPQRGVKSFRTGVFHPHEPHVFHRKSTSSETPSTAARPMASRSSSKSSKRKPLYESRWLDAQRVVTERVLVVREGFDLDSPLKPQLAAGSKVFLLQSKALPNGDVRGCITESPIAGAPPLGWVTMIKSGQRLLSNIGGSAEPVSKDVGDAGRSNKAGLATLRPRYDYLGDYRSIHAAGRFHLPASA